MIARKRLLAIECAAMFLIPPVAVCLLNSRSTMFLILWLAAIWAGYLISREPGFSMKEEWNVRAVNRAAMIPILKRFALAALLMTGLVLWLVPESLFGFPLGSPLRWYMVMILYPPLSVLPQSLLFRSLAWRRYGRLFKKEWTWLLMSASSFAFAHIMLRDPLPIVMCFIGGWIFADTYRRHRSLALACVEHALYGCWVFTVGLNGYFFSGLHMNP